MQNRFIRAPYIEYDKGSDWGLVGFDKTLSEDDITFVKENIKTLNSHDVTWSIVEGSEFAIIDCYKLKSWFIVSLYRGRREEFPDQTGKLRCPHCTWSLSRWLRFTRWSRRSRRTWWRPWRPRWRAR